MTAPRPRRQLTEPEAWRLIAERIANGNWRMDGLCLEVDRLLFYHGYAPGVAVAMSGRLERHCRDDVTYSGVYAFTPGEADVRVLAALFLALEAEDE